MEIRKKRLWLPLSVSGMIKEREGDLEFSNFIAKGIEKAENLLMSYPKKHRTEILHKCIDLTLEHASKNMQGKISCKKGCAHCCHIPVAATSSEVERIAEYVKKKGIPYSRKRLVSQAKVKSADEWVKKARRNLKMWRCVFLTGKNTCGIYPIRPASCRLYQVSSPPENCDITQDELPTELIAMEAEFFLAAEMNMDLDLMGEISASPAEAENMSAKLLKLL